jgi:hypothetical protein
MGTVGRGQEHRHRRAMRARGRDELQRVITDLERHPGLRGPRGDDFLEAATLLALQLRVRD